MSFSICWQSTHYHMNMRIRIQTNIVKTRYLLNPLDQVNCKEEIRSDVIRTFHFKISLINEVFLVVRHFNLFTDHFNLSP